MRNLRKCMSAIFCIYFGRRRKERNGHGRAHEPLWMDDIGLVPSAHECRLETAGKMIDDWTKAVSKNWQFKHVWTSAHVICPCWRLGCVGKIQSIKIGILVVNSVHVFIYIHLILIFWSCFNLIIKFYNFILVFIFSNSLSFFSCHYLTYRKYNSRLTIRFVNHIGFLYKWDDIRDQNKTNLKYIWNKIKL